MRFFQEIMVTVFLLTCVVGQRQGDLCVTADTIRPGVCTHIFNCSVVMEAATLGKLVQLCVSSENKLIVCCPWAPGQETGLESRCEENTPSVPSEGSNCTMKDSGRSGDCRLFANCQTAKSAASKGIFPQKCDSTNHESNLVCCAEPACPSLPQGIVAQLPIGSKAADYCIELGEKLFPCQQTSFGWTRGHLCPLLMPDYNVQYHSTPLISTTEAPHYGRLGTGQIANVNWLVNAVTLLSDRWVVCSANTIENYGLKEVKFLGLGGSFIPRYIPDEIYSIIRTLIHPEFDKTNSLFYNDIALLQVDRQVQFTKSIMPACLHTGSPLPSSGLILTGWHISPSPDAKTSMAIVSQEECSRVFNSDQPDGVKHHLQMCSRPVKAGGACAGWWRGSPLTLYNGPRVACTSLLVGITSAYDSTSCTTSNTRIAGYIPWIESIVWP